MVKVGVVTPNSLLTKVIDKLYDLQALQIEEYTKSDEFDIGNPLVKGEELSDTIVKLKSIASHIGLEFYRDDFKRRHYTSEQIKISINRFYENIKKRIDKIDYTQKILPILKKKTYKKALEEIKIETNRAKDKDSIHFCGLTKKDVQKQISEISETYNITTRDVDGVKLTLLFMPKSKKDEAIEILDENLFTPIPAADVKKAHDIDASYIGEKVNLAELSKELKSDVENLKEYLTDLKYQYEDFLLNSNEKLEEEVEKAVSPVKFAASKQVHVINGWVPEKKFNHVKETLEDETNNKVYVHKIPLKKNETGPILLKNPVFAKPFQFLLDLFSLPNYTGFDPTLLMWITFPLFFGFMLGDIGYGVVTLIFFVLMRIKFKKGAMNSLLNILIWSSLGTILFGALFGEVFGEEVLFGHKLPHILSRAHQITDLLSISLLIGMAHLVFGLILGFIQVAKDHDLKHAVEEKLGWILLMPFIMWLLIQLGVITGFVAGGIIPMLPPPLYTGIIAGVGAVLIILGEGVIGVIELPAILSNILSYARLMAVGLASVELALIVNQMAKEMFSSGIVGIIGGVLLLLIGHLINIMLGILGPFLHSLRLHYVEWFGKFYEGGGQRFMPFGEKT